MSETRTPEPVYDLARRLVASGISCVPIRPDGSKAPPEKWEAYIDRLPTESELRRWLIGRRRGIAAIGGGVSGGLECLDFDEPRLFGRFADDVEMAEPGLLATLAIVDTPSGGAHVWFRSDRCEPNQVLAKRPPTESEVREKPKTKWYKRIETRGSGGYAILPGSPSECHPSGKPYLYNGLGVPCLTKTAKISLEQRQLLLAACRSFTTYAEAPKSQIPPTHPRGNRLAPGTDYDNRGDWRGLLEPHGWTLASGSWTNGRLTRPGKDRGVSATIGHCRGPNGEPLLNVFSSSAGIDPGAYGLFRAFAQLNHGGDYSAAARVLAERGFGERAFESRDSSPSLVEVKPWTVKPTAPPPSEGITAADLINLELPPPKFAVGDLLCEGLTILGGRPKQGKSWLSLLIAWAVAGGNPLDGRNVEGGDVLFLALEDTRRRLQQRLNMLRPAAWDFPTRLHMHTQWQRADQGGLYYLSEWLTAHRETARLVVIDTLAKFRKPLKGTGNSYADDYEALGEVKALVDQFGVSALVIHHTRKLQAEDPFDELSGTLAISGAADGLMVLDRKRGDDHARLFVTGRDVPEATVPLSLDRETYRWTLGPSADGINTDGRHVSPASNRVDQCAAWVRDFLREFAYPSAEILEAAELAGFNLQLLKKAKAKLGKEGTGEVVNHNYGSQGNNDWWSGLGEWPNWVKRPTTKKPERSEPSERSEQSGRWNGQEIPD